LAAPKVIPNSVADTILSLSPEVRIRESPQRRCSAICRGGRLPDSLRPTALNELIAEVFALRSQSLIGEEFLGATEPEPSGPQLSLGGQPGLLAAWSCRWVILRAIVQLGKILGG
jgi:hypothetical protein